MKNKTILFYTLAFGHQSYYRQAQLLIISLLTHSRGEHIKIRVYTDNTEFFSLYAKEASIEIIPVDKTRLEEIRATHHNYNFANKLQLIQDISSDPAYAGSVFLDTDIVAHHSLKDFISLLREGTLFMYKKEHRYAGESKKEYWNALNSIDLLSHSVGSHSSQWNSGIVGITSSAAHLITDAMVIMDNLLLAGVKQHTPEQVAISVVLENTGNLNAATDFFIHYHSNKEGWTPVSDEIQQRRSEGETLLSLIDWYDSQTKFPAEKIHENRIIKVLTKWRKSLTKRLLK